MVLSAPLEVVPYIPVTALMLGLVAIVSIKFVGPIPPYPASRDEPARQCGLALVEFLIGVFLLYVQVRTLVTLASKPQWTPTYLVDSNRLFYTIFVLVAAGFLMSEALASPSAWQVALLAITGVGTAGFLELGLLSGEYDDLEFMEYAVGIVVMAGVAAWLANVVAERTLSRKRPGLFRPLWVPRARVLKVASSAPSYLFLFALSLLFTYLSWADVPVF
ncbi:MAG: hypothetical protein ACTSU5_22210 [Promethearchaeota archaeon]